MAHLIKTAHAAALAALIIGGARALGAQQTDSIVGRVTSDSGRGLPGITVIATRAPDRAFLQAMTDSAGRYVIAFANGSGDYLVYAAPVGYKAFRKRVTRSAPIGALVVDIVLAPQTTVLAAVQTTATRPRPLPDAGRANDPAAADQYTPSLVGFLSPTQRGDLTALAATLPGISLTSDGSPVAFGLPGQFNTTFNGVAYNANRLPVDALAAVRVTTSAYDPSIGGFGAGRINIEMAQGGRVHRSYVRATLEPASLQTNSAGLADRFTRVGASATADGPFGETDTWYNTALQIQRRRSDALSLASASPEALRLAGLALDSAARIRAIAARAGLPIDAAAAASGLLDQGVVFVGRVDHYKDPRRYGKLWSNAVSLTTSLAANQSDWPGASPLVAPEYGRRSSDIAAQAIGQWLHLGTSYSTEVLSSFAASRASSDPYLHVPTARILVPSSLDLDGSTLRTVSLGAYPTTGSSDAASWEALGNAYFYLNKSNKIKVHVRSMLEHASSAVHANTLGTFTFNSLADFDANRPAAYSRALSVPTSHVNQWRGTLAIGDVWQITPTFQLLPGVRIDGDAYLSASPATFSSAPFTTEAFSIPKEIHASPRLGFAWSYAPRVNVSVGGGSVGTITLPNRGVLSGGIGEFRNELTARDAFGLDGFVDSGASSQVRCIGVAAPVPDWRSFSTTSSAGPATCVGGASVFSDASPEIHGFASGFRAPRSWRANLQWGSALGWLNYGANATYSLNVNQPGLLDLNLARTQDFALVNENGRPVYASPSEIDPATGQIAPVGARLSPTSGRILSRVSDLRSTARQLTLTISPQMARSVLRLDYTLSRVDATTRGFDLTTFSSPFDRQTARSEYDARHSFVLSAGHRFSKGFGATLFVTARSGLPFTPLVGGDINGDGLQNDRAFVFDPSSVADSALRTGLTSLLATSPAATSRCLRRQLGGVAGASSCEGPWSAIANAAISSETFHVLNGHSATFELDLANVLGGVDQLLHGASGLRGWGSPSSPDPTLLYVRGFDASTRTFRYVVNSRFGVTRPSESLIRAPFRVTISMRLEVGQPLQRQNYDRFRAIDAFRKNYSPAPADSIQSRLADLIEDAYAVLARSQDSLLLTRPQIDTLEKLDAAYRVRASALWRELARFIVDQGDHYDIADINRRIDAVAARAWELQRSELPRIQDVLAPAQWLLARSMLRFLTDSAVRPPTYHPF